MSRSNLITIAASAILSVTLSVLANFLLDKQREPQLPDVVRAKRVELIDPNGRIRGAFELAPEQGGDVYPQLVMRDIDGRNSIEMSVRDQGYGALSFSNDHWNEGAVTLGYLGMDTDVSMGKEKDQERAKTLGRWGLLVRSPRSHAVTGIGFVNDGTPLTPIQVK